MNRQLRIAVLVTDTSEAAITDKHGDMFAMFKYAFHQASVEHNKNNYLQQAYFGAEAQPMVEMEFERFDVVNHPPQYPSKDDLENGKFHGLIITGSTRTAYDDLPWIHTLMKFIQDNQYPHIDGLEEHHQQERFKVPLIGVCFGHQIISRALGGPCEKNPNGWEFGPTKIQLTEQGQHYLQSGSRTMMCLNQFHSDHVPYLPPGFVRLATTEPHTSIQAMASTDGRCITSQGHPEIPCHTTAAYLDKLAYHLTPEFIQDTRYRLKAWAPQMDSMWFADRLLKFLLGHLPAPSSSLPLPATSCKSPFITNEYNHVEDSSYFATAPLDLDEQTVPTMALS
ncbi:class I glutamine amidotransferase-like protein [Absidia repens]|uniref:Class I glutamine amidotransferase-like protein n=1 Tax=Absidia repens TaxID=90262 RepID=A0A1X2IX06_9FUNG|nr:class I glutamine amidotransferase-like protein [Absidia repens]